MQGETVASGVKPLFKERERQTNLKCDAKSKSKDRHWSGDQQMAINRDNSQYEKQENRTRSIRGISKHRNNEQVANTEQHFAT